MIKENKTPSREQAPAERIKNFNEVPYVYTEEEAVLEAERCLQCKNPVCIEGCPVNIDIKEFIRLIKERKFKESYLKIKEKNAFPAVCGRVCPQEDQCEKKCVMGKKFEPVAIGRLERFASDINFDLKEEADALQKEDAPWVMIIGSGPAGLTAAADLAKAGIKVDVYEGLHATGGVLRYGIPEFRLPKKIIDREINYIKSLGVKIHLNTLVGKTINIKEVFPSKYKAVFISAGAGLPYFLGIPGETLNGIYSANEFLTRINLMKGYAQNSSTPVTKGKRVAVIGGGNVAMDSARSALRLGAKEVIVLYRRSEKEMPARLEEYEHAKEEGIKFHFLVTPLEFKGGDNYNLQKITLLKNRLIEEEGKRARPVPIEGSEFEIELDVCVIAVGQGPNPVITESFEGLDLNKNGYIKVDDNFQTSVKGVWAGGDIIEGSSSTVITAMGAGKSAAEGIIKYLKKID